VPKAITVTAAGITGAITGVGVVLVCFTLGVLVTQVPALLVGAAAGAAASMGLVAARVHLASE